MVYRVKASCAIDFYDGPMRYEWCFDDLHRLGSTTRWANAIRGVLAVGFNDRLDHDFTRLLHHPIPYGRNPARSLPSVRCGEIDPPHRLRSVAPSPSVLLERLEKGCHALLLDVCDPDAVDAGTAPSRSDCSPGPPPPIRPEDAVVARMESAIPAPLGRLVELALELS